MLKIAKKIFLIVLTFSLAAPSIMAVMPNIAFAAIGDTYSKVTSINPGRNYLFVANINTNLYGFQNKDPKNMAFGTPNQYGSGMGSTEISVQENNLISTGSSVSGYEFTVTSSGTTNSGNQGYYIKSGSNYLNVIQILSGYTKATTPTTYAGWPRPVGFLHIVTEPITCLNSTPRVWFWNGTHFYTKYTSDINSIGQLGPNGSTRILLDENYPDVYGLPSWDMPASVNYTDKTLYLMALNAGDDRYIPEGAYEIKYYQRYFGPSPSISLTASTSENEYIGAPGSSSPNHMRKKVSLFQKDIMHTNAAVFIKLDNTAYTGYTGAIKIANSKAEYTVNVANGKATFASVLSGRYDIYANNIDTGVDFNITDNYASTSIDFYTVTLQPLVKAGLVTSASYWAKYSDNQVAFSGGPTLKGRQIILTSLASGADSYTYQWGGMATGNHQTVGLQPNSSGSVTFTVTGYKNVNISAAPKTIDHTFDVIRLSSIFNIDVNAGTRTYTIVSSPGQGYICDINGMSQTSGNYLKVLSCGDFSIRINTASLGYYNAGTATSTLTVNKVVPPYTLPSGLKAKYGQTLKDVPLPAGWLWDNPNAMVGNVGENLHSASFTSAYPQIHLPVQHNLTVTVVKHITGIRINEGPAVLHIGGTTAYTATVSPAGYSAKNPVTWHIGNENVAIVSENGVVTAIGTGSTNITAKIVDNDNQNTEFTTPPVTVTVSDRVDASINPTTAAFNKYPSDVNHKDISISLVNGSYTLSGIKYDGIVLSSGIHYSYSAGVYTFLKSWLNTLSNGSHTITFDMSGGTDPELSLYVSDTTPSVNASINPISATFDKYTSSANNKDIQITLVPGSYLLSGIICDGVPLAAGNQYAAGDGIFTFVKAWLSSLSNGSHTIAFDMNGGADPSFMLNIGNSTPYAIVGDEITGGDALPFGDVEITLTDGTKVSTKADANGNWRAVIPDASNETNITITLYNTDGTPLGSPLAVTSTVKVKSIKTLPRIYLVAGKSVTLPAAVQPFGAKNKAYTWQSPNSSIVKVNSAVTGKITAGAKAAGKSVKLKVTSKDGSKVAYCTVYVVKKAVALKSMGITQTGTIGLLKGKVLQLKPALNAKNATGIVPAYRSSNTKVAAVDKVGYITALKKGKANITVTAGKYRKTFVLQVGNVSATKFSLSKSSFTLGKGKSYKLVAKSWTPSNTDLKMLTWTTSNKKAVTVSGNGLIKGIAKGKATITAKTWNGKIARCTVTVK